LCGAAGVGLVDYVALTFKLPVEANLAGILPPEVVEED